MLTTAVANQAEDQENHQSYDYYTIVHMYKHTCIMNKNKDPHVHH